MSINITTILSQLRIEETEWKRALDTERTVRQAWPGAMFDTGMADSLAPFIDHTLLKPDATDKQIDALCEEALQYGFASVCVNSCHIARCSAALAGADTIVCGVVGFPLGAMASEAKAYETRSVIADGAREVDMVINIGKLKSGDFQYVKADITAVCNVAGEVPVKVILETGLLDASEIVSGCVIAVLTGATFVKTSTGFGHGGATEEHVRLMREVVGGNVGVKASGGVRDFESTVRMIRAGANRIGTSNGVAIVEGAAGKGTGY